MLIIYPASRFNKTKKIYNITMSAKMEKKRSNRPHAETYVFRVKKGCLIFPKS